MIEPKYYKNTSGKDLIDMLAEQLSVDGFRGYMKGNIIKYTIRYEQKNKLEDLEKAETYLRRLKSFEAKLYLAQLVKKREGKHND